MNPRSKLMIVIADDLTGANDTGVQFARQGLKTEVLLEGTPIGDSYDAEIVVADTNSRAVKSDLAYKLVQQAAEQAYNAGYRHYYKKMDSTLRGNVGVEIKAILDLGYHEFALVMPAFPQNGRTTVGGHHLVQGVPLAATEIAKDPKCPVTETVLPKLLEQQTGCKIGHIGINELNQEETIIIKAIRSYIADGCKIITCDAWLEQHFELVARSVLQVTDQVLWCGSAGLAECLPQVLGWSESVLNKKPILVVAGSVSAVTRGQVERLLAKGFKLIEIEVSEHLPWQSGSQLSCLEEALASLAGGENVVLASGYDPSSVEKAKAAGAELGLSSLEVSNCTAEILGQVGSAILRRQEVAGVVLTGGDTAVSVCRALGVKGIRVLEEVVSGIPFGSMTTDEGKSLHVVTKAGAFGSADALVKAVRMLQNKEEK